MIAVVNPVTETAARYHELQGRLQEQQARRAALTTAADHAETRIAALQERKAELLHQAAQGRDVGEELAAIRLEIAELQAATGDQSEVKARLVEEIAETERASRGAAHEWRSARADEMIETARREYGEAIIVSAELADTLTRIADTLNEAYTLRGQQYGPYGLWKRLAESIRHQTPTLW